MLRTILRAAIAVFAAAAPAAAADVVGWASVPSGDILLVNGQNYRLFGIDAVEPHQVCFVEGKPWACGPSAIRTLEILVGPEPVVCSGTGESAGAFGLWARCAVGGKDIAGEMVKAGVAIANRSQSTEYVAAEDVARQAKAGVWRSAFVEPWQLRDDMEAIEFRVISGLRGAVGGIVDGALTDPARVPIFEDFEIVRDDAAATERSFNVRELMPGFVVLAVAGDVFTWEDAGTVVARWENELAGTAAGTAFDEIWKAFETLPQKVTATDTDEKFRAAMTAAAAPMLAAGRQPVLVVANRTDPTWLSHWLDGDVPEGMTFEVRPIANSRYVATLDGVDVYIGNTAEGRCYIFASDILSTVAYRPTPEGGLATVATLAPAGAELPSRLSFTFRQTATFKPEEVTVLTFPFTPIEEIYD